MRRSNRTSVHRRGLAFWMVGATSLAWGLAPAAAAADSQHEIEPNGTAGTATALASNPVKVTGYVYGNGDVDYFSFAAAAGDRIYAAVMTSANAAPSTDSLLEIIGTDGTTIVESDNDNGSFGLQSSSIAGSVVPAAGTYFVRVKHAVATGQLRPYDLYVRVHPGAAGPPPLETEPNNFPATQPLPAGGWVSGNTSSATDTDYYTLPVNAGDTIFASLDLDPERDGVEWDGSLGIGLFSGTMLNINDLGGPGSDSEAHLMTVRDAGTFMVAVSAPPGGTTFGTYQLSVSVIPENACTSGTLTSVTNSTAVVIPDQGTVTSTITIPPGRGGGGPRVGRVRVGIAMTHEKITDIDATLIAPTGQEVALFTDVGPLGPGTMNLVLDDGAALPVGVNNFFSAMRYQPEGNSRLNWFNGIDGGGDWTLVLRDDAAAGNGQLSSWRLEICDEPLEPCPEDTVTMFSSDFEIDGGSFTHSGAQDEWEWGPPTFAPLTGAFSGTKCWKTDLDNAYNASSSQDLLSPPIDLSAAKPPVHLRWAQNYQIESASFDRAFIDVEQSGGGGSNARRVWEWLGPTMTVTAGTVIIQTSGGWAMLEADISDYAGQVVQMRVHLDSDLNNHLAGLAIDDVSVIACGGLETCPADIDNSGGVNVDDLLAVINGWGAAGSSDVNGDGVTNVDDLLAVINAWGACS